MLKVVRSRNGVYYSLGSLFSEAVRLALNCLPFSVVPGFC